ncbi:MAG: DUF3306 domain-containing protein [Steroidobacteraceae bacterium]
MSERDPADFLARWSRLKERAREEARSPPPAAQVPESAEPAAEDTLAVPAASAAPQAEVQLPNLDLLDGDSDYSAFLSPGVDLLLRRRALRKLFHSPKFNVLDGLDDYMGDFRNFEPLGDLVTADMRHRIEQAARRLAEKLEEPRAATPDALAATPVEDPTPEEEPANDRPADPA